MNEEVTKQLEGAEQETALIVVVAEDATNSTPAAAEASDPRVDDLERRIRELEAAIGDLRTVSAAAVVTERREHVRSTGATGRKTQASYAPHLLAKGAEPAKTGSVDAALGSLSVEQRFAVKAGLLRAGLL